MFRVWFFIKMYDMENGTVYKSFKIHLNRGFKLISFGLQNRILLFFVCFCFGSVLLEKVVELLAKHFVVDKR